MIHQNYNHNYRYTFSLIIKYSFYIKNVLYSDSTEMFIYHIHSLFNDTIVYIVHIIILTTVSQCFRNSVALPTSLTFVVGTLLENRYHADNII